MPAPNQTPAVGGAYAWYVSSLRRVVSALGIVAGVAVVAMIAVTCVDVVGRWLFSRPIKGAYDIVELLGAIVIAGGLPYTTGCKGHVAIEFFWQRLSRRGRILVDTVARLITVSMFAFLTWRFVHYGVELRASGQGTPTLGWPVFWLAWWLALCTGVMVLVILYHLMHPGKELMKP
ncbi:MAG: TRAP transporter small permease [Phycisphaerae bacterium]|nr:TRAP transporter small permease [Phycisphaerae bacterium]